MLVVASASYSVTLQNASYTYSLYDGDPSIKFYGSRSMHLYPKLGRMRTSKTELQKTGTNGDDGCGKSYCG
jgi:hypothetical protein